MNTAAPGWYPDPTQGGRIRYWDGTSWMDAQPTTTPTPTATPTMPSAPAAPVYPQQPVPAAYNPQPVATSKTSGLAIASIVCSIAGTAVAGIGFIAGIILGHMALSEISKSGGRIEGRGLALAGLIIGYVLAALCVIAIVVIIAIFANDPTFFDDVSA